MAKGELFSDDRVSKTLNGQSSDIVPVALSYEGLGALERYRVRRNWEGWKKRLEEAGEQALALDYEMHLGHMMSVETEILERIYTRPAWVALPRNRMPEEVNGSAIIAQGEELYWVTPEGNYSRLERTLEGRESEVGKNWADLWERRKIEAVLEREASDGRVQWEHEPAPMPEQAKLVAESSVYDLARRLVKRFPNELPLYSGGDTPYNGLTFMLGFQGLMLALTEMPDKVHALLRNRLPRPNARRAGERELGVRLLFLEECLASADIISPRMYQEFAFAYDKPTLEFYEGLGFRTILYFSGNLMPFLPYLKELPFTALAFEEDRKGYGIDLGEIRRALGPDRVLFGNLDAMFVEKANDEEVLAEVKRQISVAGSQNFIISLGSPVTPGTTLERVRLICESTKILSS